MVSAPNNTQVINTAGDIDVGNQMEDAKQIGRDMNEESTTQNFFNIAKQGDLSPSI